MSQQVSGSFDITLKPQTLADPEADRSLARLSLDKTFHGPLDATSRGEMLSAMTATKGSAGYVALERVSGTLNGRSGTFVLVHLGLVDRGTPNLSVTVVPDSGTDALTGLTGTISLTNSPSGHTYTLTYTLPDPASSTQRPIPIPDPQA